jgi:hypothetical protein
MGSEWQPRNHIVVALVFVSKSDNSEPSRSCGMESVDSSMQMKNNDQALIVFKLSLNHQNAAGEGCVITMIMNECLLQLRVSLRGEGPFALVSAALGHSSRLRTSESNCFTQGYLTEGKEDPCSYQCHHYTQIDSMPARASVLSKDISPV